MIRILVKQCGGVFRDETLVKVQDESHLMQLLESFQTGEH